MTWFSIDAGGHLVAEAMNPMRSRTHYVLLLHTSHLWSHDGLFGTLRDNKLIIDMLFCRELNLSSYNAKLLRIRHGPVSCRNSISGKV